MIFLSNIYLYHYVTVISMCFMYHQRLPRCPQQSTKQGKPTSSYSSRLARLANVIYDVGVSTSGEPVLVVFTVDVVVNNSVVCIWCTFSLVLLLINVLHRSLIVYWQEIGIHWAILFNTQEYNRRYLFMERITPLRIRSTNKSVVLEL